MGHRAELARTLRRTTIWSLVFQLVSKFSLFAITLLAGRKLPVSEFGAFVTAQGVLLVFAAVLDRGISLTVERGIPAGIVSRSDAWTTVRGRAVEAVVVLLVTSAAVIAATDFGVVTSVALGFATSSIYLSSLTNGVLQGVLEFGQSAKTMSVGRLCYLILVASLYLLDGVSLAAVSIAWAIGEASTCVIQFALLRKILSRLGRDGDRGNSERLGYLGLMAQSLPYWLSVVAFLGYNRADSAIAFAFSDSRVAGIYAPASSIQNAFMIIPSALTGSLAVVGAAELHKGGNARVSALVAAVRHSTVFSVLVSVILTCGGISLAPQIVEFSLSSRYSDSVVPARILLFSLPMNAVEFALLGLLIALGKPRFTVFFYVICLVVSVTANSILTPRYGASGAAIASLLREPAGLIVLLIGVRRGLSELRFASE